MPPAALSVDAVNWIIAVWMFAFGGALGSFLNVVIYRLPAGISVVKPGSHCPKCKTAIRWFDNVPILSWLLLRGRCRDCRCKISVRYPAVEATTATLFLALGVVECLWDGANLPQGPTSGARNLGVLYGICAYHLLLFCTLLAAVVIEWDWNRVPPRLFAPAMAGGLVAPLAWPHLHPVAACPALEGWIAGLTDATAGLAAGTVLGWLGSHLPEPKQKTGMVLCTACVGLFLGWQAVCVLAVAALAIQLLMLTLGRVLPGARRIPPTAWLALAALGWVLAWAAVVERWRVLG